MKKRHAVVAAIAGVSAALAAPSSTAQENRPVVAVVSMTANNGGHSGEVSSFAQMIETEIAATGRFRTFERSQIGALVTEQALAKQGMTNGDKRIGGFEGVDYLIYGQITAFSEQVETIPLLNCLQKKAVLSADIRITDAQSGEIKYVSRIDEVAKSTAACGEGVSAHQLSVDQGALLRSASKRIASGLVTAIYPMKVVSIDSEGFVVLNYGEGAVTKGDTLAIYSIGDPIVDPDSGEVLGANERRLGHVKVVETLARISRATAIDVEAEAFSVGNVARKTTDRVKPAKKKK